MGQNVSLRRSSAHIGVKSTVELLVIWWAIMSHSFWLMSIFFSFSNNNNNINNDNNNNSVLFVSRFILEIIRAKLLFSRFLPFHFGILRFLLLGVLLTSSLLDDGNAYCNDCTLPWCCMFDSCWLACTQLQRTHYT